ncbi:uncharacterized protein BT62DRAFT_790822 [Guyanagaster necrorhizus]|uniref:Uncharacterized protein n=1 Tax=Guyanagaster necrorhizus TaxID=856835 RepID=A0A9P7VXQ5_9AGAR|nr:uncharacterized protein BT62DRAFT_790822 [Guyanagaster necrorhizus MCA 3950]KAG7447746.1 hypothetical protein BT62DRAFT_790822 [Guyanagaster necrorhizus MCA 3950]
MISSRCAPGTFPLAAPRLLLRSYPSFAFIRDGLPELNCCLSCRSANLRVMRSGRKGRRRAVKCVECYRIVLMGIIICCSGRGVSRAQVARGQNPALMSWEIPATLRPPWAD